jgi:hypothetical protein
MKALFTLIFIFIAALVVAQEPVVTWKQLSAEEFQFKSIVPQPGSSNFVKLSLQKEGKRKNTKWNAILTRYDASLNALQSVSIANPLEDGNYEYLFQLNNKTYCVFRKQEEDKVYSFSVQQIDLNSLQPTGKPVQVGTFSVLTDASVIAKPYTISSDGKSVLFFGFAEEKKSNSNSYVLAQFNEDMQEKWRKTLPNQKGEYHRILGVDNQGVAICAKFEPIGGKLEKKAKLLHVSAQPAIDEIPVEVTGNFVNELKILSDVPGGYRLFGLYGQVAGRGNSGYFTADVNPSEKKATIIIKENFALSLLQKLAKQIEAFNQPLHLTGSFEPIYIFHQPNETIHIILENRSKDFLQHTRDNRNLNKRVIPESEIVWLNMSIIDIVLQKDGKSTVNLFSKQQHTDASDRLGSEFVALPHKEDVLFFYNGWRSNVENDKPIVLHSFGFADYSKSSFVFAKMEKDGSIEKKVLFDNKSNGFYPSIVHFHKVSDTKIIIVGQKVLDPADVSQEVLGFMEIK